MIYLEIFWVFFRIGFVAFGSVIAVLPQLEQDLVTRGWITHEQFFQSFIIGQFVPGPNVAMCPLIGYRVAGAGGWLAAFLGIYGSPILIMAATCGLYRRYRHVPWVRRLEIALRPVVIGLIVGSGVKIFVTEARPNLVAAVLVSATGCWLMARRYLGPLSVVFLIGLAWWARVQVFP